jgi:hypothetical protein
MIYLKMGPKTFWVELWSPLLAFSKWDFHVEHRSALFDTHACWVGPFHIIICDTRRGPSLSPSDTRCEGVAENG